MTADRRNDRRSNRNQQSSPYSKTTRQAKSAPKESTSWSFSGFLNFLNPLRSLHSADSENDSSETSHSDELDNQAGQPSVSRNGYPPQAVPQIPPSTPPARSAAQPQPASSSVPQSPSNLGSNTSPLKNVDAVKNYLAENGSRQLNPVEIAGLVSLLQDSIDGADEEPEPFRFSRSPSRGNSPVSPIISTSAFSADGNQTPSKPLSKNPNGSYKWQGAGSARPRNRFHSPAFGPSRSTPSKMKITPTETPKTDTKRRRVGHDAETSSPQRVPVTSSSTDGAAASTSQSTAGPSNLSNGPSRVNGTRDSTSTNAKAAGANGVATPRVAKPTTPAVPSPLRQAWGQTDSPSPSPPQTLTSKQTRAASFMTELIREATPTKKPDVSNPYQTASPVKPSKPPTKKVPPKRARPVTQTPAEEKVELSPQAIIEATVPKGSKRSRPPSSLCATDVSTNSVAFPSDSPSPPSRLPLSLNNGLFNPPVNGGRNAIVETVEDEEGGPSIKKQKTITSFEPTIVEVKDMSSTSPPEHIDSLVRPSEVVEPVEEHSSQQNGTASATSPTNAVSSQNSSRSFFGVKSSTVPKEPSKLRFSIQADRDEKEELGSGASDGKRNAKLDTLSLSLTEIPTHSFHINILAMRSSRPRSEAIGEKDARDLAVVKLPTYDWTFSSSLLASKSSASPDVESDASSPAPTAGFNWAAAGMKAPGAASKGSWVCSTCLVPNTSGDVDNCAVCDTPRVR